jgi:hypothetical protein
VDTVIIGMGERYDLIVSAVEGYKLQKRMVRCSNFSRRQVGSCWRRLQLAPKSGQWLRLLIRFMRR